MRRKIWSDRDVENGLPVASGTAADDPVQALLAQIEASLPTAAKAAVAAGPAGSAFRPGSLPSAETARRSPSAPP